MKIIMKVPQWSISAASAKKIQKFSDPLWIPVKALSSPLFDETLP